MSGKNKAMSAQGTVQAKLQKLSELVAWFQGPDFILEAAVDTYKEAEALAEEIEKSLTELKNEITVVKQKFDQA